jgi:hypothetical protein
MNFSKLFGGLCLVSLATVSLAGTSATPSNTIKGNTPKQICSAFLKKHSDYDQCYLYIDKTTYPVYLHSADWPNRSDTFQPGQCYVDYGQPLNELINIYDANNPSIQSSQSQHATDSKYTNQASVITYSNKAGFEISDYTSSIPNGECSE